MAGHLTAGLQILTYLVPESSLAKGGRYRDLSMRKPEQLLRPEGRDQEEDGRSGNDSQNNKFEQSSEKKMK